MSDLTDPVVAAAAVTEQSTSAVDLSVIAQHHPSLRAQVALHPAAYPGLLDWLERLGDPMLTAVVAVRRDADRKAGAPPGQPVPPAAAPQAGQPVPFTQPVQTAAQAAAAWTAAGPVAQPVPPEEPAPKRSRGRRPLLIGAAALVLVVALVAGFATRGFGLLHFGGAATPQEEAIKVADKTVGLLNSFSLKNLISNPLSAIGDLSDEIAPSESSLDSQFTKVDNSDLLALTNDSMNLATDFLGAFTVTADGLKTEVTEVTDDIAQVDFVEGEITVTADTDRLEELLPKLPDVASAQAEATLAKYGLTPKKSVDLNLPSGWSDDLLSTIEDKFPYRVDLSDCAAWRTSGESLDSSELASICAVVGQIVVVKEAGKWYLSPMLSWTGISGGINGYILNRWTGVGGAPNQLNDPERQKMLSVSAAEHSEPADAPAALVQALVTGDEQAILAELPLAERRYAAASGLLADASLNGYSSKYHFTEITRSGNQAKIRVDQLNLSSGGVEFGITDGTCINYFGSSGCLSDLKQSGAIDDAFSSLKQQDWTSFEESTGVSGDKVVSKLETATKAALKAIDPDQVGLVAVQEDGGWLVSFTASYGELQSQASAALRAGLLSIQE